jgi:hypothetical protein
MKDYFSRGQPGSSQVAPAAWGCLLVVICLVVITALLHGNIAQARSQEQPSATRCGPDFTKRADLLWYFDSGQWRADVRSLAAAIRFLLEAVDDPGNQVLPAAPTNRPGGPYPN